MEYVTSLSPRPASGGAGRRCTMDERSGPGHGVPACTWRAENLGQKVVRCKARMPKEGRCSGTDEDVDAAPFLRSKQDLEPLQFSAESRSGGGSATSAHPLSPSIWSYASSAPKLGPSSPRREPSHRATHKRAIECVPLADSVGDAPGSLPRDGAWLLRSRICTNLRELGSFLSPGVQGVIEPYADGGVDLSGLLSTRLYGLSADSRRRREKIVKERPASAAPSSSVVTSSNQQQTATTEATTGPAGAWWLTGATNRTRPSKRPTTSSSHLLRQPASGCAAPKYLM